MRLQKKMMKKMRRKEMKRKKKSQRRKKMLKKKLQNRPQKNKRLKKAQKSQIKKKKPEKPIAKQQEAKKKDSKTKETGNSPKENKKQEKKKKDTNGQSTQPDPQTTQIIKLPSGLQYQEVKIGHGPPIRDGQWAKVRYKGLLQDGHQFDSNMPRGKPLTFQIGSGNVIQGWSIGIAGMRADGRRNLLIPPHLGYGAAGSPPDIPPNAPLIFEVHLLGIQ